MIRSVQQLLDKLYKEGKRIQIVTIEFSASARDAAQVMFEDKINFLVVTNKGNYIGVVSTSDTSREFGSSLRPSETMILDIMTPAVDVVKVSLDDKVMELPQKLKLHQIRHLIVTDEANRWIAVLDTNECLSAVMANIAEEEEMWAQFYSEFRRTD